MIRDIVVVGDPVLTQIARDVSPEELPTSQVQQVIDDLVQTLRSSPGVGLAAPQIGESLRIVVVDKPMTILVNPVVTPIGETTSSSAEGCLSVPGIVEEVTRAHSVRVQGLDRKGKPIDALWTHFRAKVVQHEVDHLNGILFVDRVADAPKLPFRPVATDSVSPTGKGKIIIVESPFPVSGKQHVSFFFDRNYLVTGLRIQPASAMITDVYLAGVSLKRRNFQASTVEQMICGADGLRVTAGNYLRIEMKIHKGKRKIVAEADIDDA